MYAFTSQGNYIHKHNKNRQMFGIYFARKVLGTGVNWRKYMKLINH